MRGLEGASLETARRDAMAVNWSFEPNCLVLANWKETNGINTKN